jgi:putative long chain acyl-CoA synthase
VLALGGGGRARRLPAGVVDLEQIDPDAVVLPKWYRANAGRARDAAFIVFTGTGERTRADRITNGRWAQSALGAASAAKLTAADTVYSVNPLHHPSGCCSRPPRRPPPARGWR